MTANHASRGFSDLLDAVEHGETIAITRAGHVVAEIRPAAASTGRALREALADVPRLSATAWCVAGGRRLGTDAQGGTAVADGPTPGTSQPVESAP